MDYSPSTLTELVDIVSKTLTAIFGIIAGVWVYFQYREAKRVRAAETLLKLEDEFRIAAPVFELIEDPIAYKTTVEPALKEALGNGCTMKESLETLSRVDRALRFFYICAVLDGTLRGGVAGRALHRAYYHYIAMLLPEAQKTRPDLLKYTDKYYPRLTLWIKKHKAELTAAREGVG